MVQLRLPSPGAITSPFGNRPGGFHEGIDFGWGNGWNIYAAASGTVRHAGPGGVYGPRYGNLTILDHLGCQTRYGHQSRMYVRDGQEIAAGDLIGVKGGSGAKGPNTYDPHLHFELLISGTKVDPALYFTAPAGGDSTPIEEDELSEKDIQRILDATSIQIQRATRYRLYQNRVTGAKMALNISSGDIMTNTGGDNEIATWQRLQLVGNGEKIATVSDAEYRALEHRAATIRSGRLAQ